MNQKDPLVIIYTKELDTYYVTRKVPCYYQEIMKIILCTSETNGFVFLVNNYIPLKDNNIVKINKNNYEFL